MQLPINILTNRKKEIEEDAERWVSRRNSARTDVDRYQQMADAAAKELGEINAAIDLMRAHTPAPAGAEPAAESNILTINRDFS